MMTLASGYWLHAVNDVPGLEIFIWSCWSNIWVVIVMYPVMNVFHDSIFLAAFSVCHLK